MAVSYMIIQNYSIDAVMHEVTLSSRTAANWNSFVHQIFEEWALKAAQKIGGVGKTVEIDESKFGKRKYNRGHRMEGQWVFGGIERESGNIFLVPVELRNAETLVELIKEWVLPGTTIMSDCFKAYDHLGEQGYTHLTVNHSINIVDSASGAHTNTIESTWRHVKRFMPHYKRLKQCYLVHYMFLKWCKSHQREPMVEFLLQLAQIDFFAMEDTDSDSSNTE